LLKDITIVAATQLYKIL